MNRQRGEIRSPKPTEQERIGAVGAQNKMLQIGEGDVKVADDRLAPVCCKKRVLKLVVEEELAQLGAQGPQKVCQQKGVMRSDPQLQPVHAGDRTEPSPGSVIVPAFTW